MRTWDSCFAMRVKYPGRPRRLGAYDYAQDGAYSVTIGTAWRKQLFGRVTERGMELNSAGRAVEEVWQGLPEHYPHVELDVFVVMPDHVHGIVVFVGGGLDGRLESGQGLGSLTGGSRAEEAGFKPASTQKGGTAREGARAEEGGWEAGRTQEGRGTSNEASRAEEAGWKPSSTQEGGGIGTDATRAEEAGYKPASTQGGTQEEETGWKPGRTQHGRGTGADAFRAEEAGYKPARTKSEGPRRHGLSEVVRGFKTYSGRRVNEVRGTPGAAVWRRGFYEHVVRNEEDMNRIRQYFLENPLRWWLKRENEGVEGRGPRRIG